jgi:hypothetical protein
MDGGHVHGREAVRAYWTRQWTMVSPHVEPVSFHRPSDDAIGGESDGCGEVGREFVVAGGDAAEVFAAAERCLDTPAILVAGSILSASDSLSSHKNLMEF